MKEQNPVYNGEKPRRPYGPFNPRLRNRRTRLILAILALGLFAIAATTFAVGTRLITLPPFFAKFLPINLLDRLPFVEGPSIEVPFVPLGKDTNENGIDDALDIVKGARLQVEAHPTYKSQYYAGGYPPDNEGVCTDLIWRALKYIGYNLKEFIDKDIAANRREYPRASNPDPNIDFRRVPNLYVFFKRNHKTLTTDLRPGDLENLKQWQPGDIVILGRNNDHIGIVSDKKRRDGVPLIIHHVGGHPSEDDALRYWPISGHFRLEL